MIFRPTTIQSKSFVDPGKGIELPPALVDMLLAIRGHARGNRVIASSMQVSF
jgi:hypothetical protein